MALRQNMEHGPHVIAPVLHAGTKRGRRRRKAHRRSVAECSPPPSVSADRPAAFAQAPAPDSGRGGRRGLAGLHADSSSLATLTLLTEPKCGDSTCAMVEIWRASRTRRLVTPSYTENRTEAMPGTYGGRVRD